jgi:hypothetical protein
MDQAFVGASAKATISFTLATRPAARARSGVAPPKELSRHEELQFEAAWQVAKHLGHWFNGLAFIGWDGVESRVYFCWHLWQLLLEGIDTFLKIAILSDEPRHRRWRMYDTCIGSIFHRKNLSRSSSDVLFISEIIPAK